ncbi:MAG: RND family efflux transporter MFP subunit [Candidatus Moranbacteria bacterium GW2011_GWE2_35_2-]|nr:MAG: RND family efflux transporter MFP subunit [Candidatus Moranbacteria bacterium GW2011_GWE2_35_2-]KKQ06426.1 MAG: RND family efflux transporter MFP subunit [Candidatus Moranbacteria bacterium GW2011_GWF1_36_4]KKQ22897.1 MAG: RND family efflux transporter MFP subunit [Candidatus Moranbacteria bacterium GW2011_GWF2_37_11]KKQ29255.1 MAG: RND family efflux transporter MFP subunit [Candidatus Moranbacteria bacterium GW2011_GWD1_37_17]KKQ30872.1 MAG: RND family efflux transporter MFP subunit [C
MFVAIAGISGTFLFFHNTSPKTVVANSNPAKKVIATPIALSEFLPENSYCAFAVGKNRTEITPEINGMVRQLFKNEGDLVRAGEILAIIDDSTISANARGLAQVSNNAKKSAVDTEKLYDQKVDEAKAALKKIEKDFDNGNATKKDVFLAEESVKSARRTRDLQISSTRIQVSEIENQQSIADNYAQKQTIRAPFSGTITRRHITIGTFVIAGTPLYSLSALDTAEIEISAPKNIIEKLSINQEIFLTKENSISTIGLIYAKSAFTNFANQNGIIRLRTKENTSHSISIGDYICAQLPLENSKKALIVPENALLYEFGDSFIFIIQDKIVHKKKVTVGKTNAGQIEIVSGLEPGNIVITEGIHEIHAGDTVIY